jgi:hypothetical protein
MGRPGIPMIFEEVLVRLAQLIPLVAGSHLRIGGRIATPVVEVLCSFFCSKWMWMWMDSSVSQGWRAGKSDNYHNR